MIPATQHELIATLADLQQLSPEVRFGQLLANLGFLVEDQTDQSLWHVEDARLLEVMEWHRADLLRRQTPELETQYATVSDGDRDQPLRRQGRQGPMTFQTFRELLRRRPFQPFRLVMSSGPTYDVRHPEMAFLTRTDILVGIDETDEGVPAEFKICSLLHVATVEPLDSTSPEPRQADGA